MARYEELTTPEAVLAAFEAGRRVEIFYQETWVQAYACCLDSDTANTVELDFELGRRYRALIEEPAIPAGYKPWGGGECPEDARGKCPELIFRNGVQTNLQIPAEVRDWKHTGGPLDIIAYRVELEQAQPDDNRAAAALRTVEAAGYTYHGGQMWKPPLGKAPAYITGEAQPSQQGEAVKARIDEIEYAIACNRMTAAQVFTQMRQLIRPIPVESLGRAADGVEGLALAVGAVVGYERKDGPIAEVAFSRDQLHEFARRLRPQVDEAMVDRANDVRERLISAHISAFMDGTGKAKKAARDRAFCKSAMVDAVSVIDALTAALTEAGHG